MVFPLPIGTVVGAAVVGIGLYLLLIAVYRALFHPLRNYPGPFLNRITKLPVVYATIKGRQPQYVASLFEKYGPVVRISPNNLGFIDAQAWKDIYGHRQSGRFEKAYEYYRQTPAGPINMINADPVEHAALRKWVAPSFSDRSMKEQEPMIGGYVDLLIDRLMQNCHGGHTAVNLREWYNFMTFDVIGKLAFSSDFGCLESSDYHPWVRMITFFNRETVYLGELKRNGFSFLIKWLAKVGLGKNRLKHVEYTKEKLLKRIESGKQPDLLEGLLHNKDGVELCLKRLQSNSGLFIIAGSETTATLLCGVTYLLLTHPESFKQVVEEVRSSYTTSEEITLTSVAKLSYMLACLNETLRCYPPAPGWMPRRVVKGMGSVIINGNVVPEGTLVSVWQLPMYHSKYNFIGPEGYHPERFFGDLKFASDKLDVLQPFSIGPNNCIGRNLAYAEMRLILARILFTFDLTLADDSRHWIKNQKIYMLWEKPILNVYMTPVPTEQ